MPEGRDHLKEAHSPESPAPAVAAGQVEGLILMTVEKRMV
jgi:hypothetical protein